MKLRPSTVNTSRRKAVLLDDHVIAAGVARRQIGRPTDALERGNVALKSLLIPDMVAERDDVHTRLEDRLAEGAGDAGAGGGVLAVGDDKIDAPFDADLRHQRAENLASRLADDVADEEELHLIPSLAFSGPRGSACRPRRWAPNRNTIA
jgi:hypothetical protein